MSKEAFFDPKRRAIAKGVTPNEWRQLQDLANRVNLLQKEFDELKAKVYVRHNSECCLDRRMKENG